MNRNLFSSSYMTIVMIFVKIARLDITDVCDRGEIEPDYSSLRLAYAVVSSQKDLEVRNHRRFECLMKN